MDRPQLTDSELALNEGEWSYIISPIVGDDKWQYKIDCGNGYHVSVIRRMEYDGVEYECAVRSYDRGRLTVDMSTPVTADVEVFYYLDSVLSFIAMVKDLPQKPVPVGFSNRDLLRRR